MVDQPTVIDADVPVPAARNAKGQYDLGSPAKDVYSILSGANRQQVCDMGRRMAELTIPSIMPPLNYRTGDDLPGNNQSVGAYAVNNLAGKLMFMAFPPGQPMLAYTVLEQKLQAQIQQDPEMYDHVTLALSRLEKAHRDMAGVIGLATPYVGYLKLLLVTGNALWKHIKLKCPTFHNSQTYAVSRDMNGHPLVTIHEQEVRVCTLDEDIQAIILQEQPELRKVEEWSRECLIYSVCRLVRDGPDDDEDAHWEYWEETEKGALITDTELDTDYDDCPMWPGWIIPVYGQNWGRSYVEEYRGDFYILESNASALNDGAAMMSLMLGFVKPGARTSLRQVQEAKNLSFLSGSAEDVTVFKTDKGADMQFTESNFERAAQRIGKAFLVMASVMRQGERVTAEEVERTGQDLDQAMGGVYTQIAQGNQRMMVTRFVHLHEEAKPEAIPSPPKDYVHLGLITGIDAMGKSTEVANLKEFGTTINTVFPPNSESSNILDPFDFASRLASAMSIKPDGLVKDEKTVLAQQAQDKQAAATQENTKAAVSGASGPMAQAMAARLAPPQGQPTPQGAPPNGQ